MKKILLMIAAAAVMFAGCQEKPEQDGGRTEEDMTDAIVPVDGFMVYEGTDPNSLHKIAIHMFTKEANDDETKDYMDINLWLYMPEPPEQLSEVTMEVPYGIPSPCLRDGSSPIMPLMYYVGEHGVTPEYEPDVRGCSWWVYETGKEGECFAADDTQNTFISIKDNGDGTYTISGKLVDKTKKTEIEFTYTDDKKVFVDPYGA